MQTAVMQHCISTRQRSQREWVAAAAIGEAAVIKPYGMVVDGVASVSVLTYRLRERENQSDRRLSNLCVSNIH